MAQNNGSRKSRGGTVNLSVSTEDLSLIKRIVARCKTLHSNLGPGETLSLEMDLAAVHLNDTPLNLHKLLSADAFNLVHDVFGIQRHIDRRTGKLTDHFFPRCVRNPLEARI